MLSLGPRKKRTKSTNSNTYKHFRVLAVLLLLLAVKRHANRFTTMTSLRLPCHQSSPNQNTSKEPSVDELHACDCIDKPQSCQAVTKMPQSLVGMSVANLWLPLSSAFSCRLLAVAPEYQTVLQGYVEDIKQLFTLVTVLHQNLLGRDRKGNYFQRRMT